ncbi:MAG: type II toxin-antitoxin system HicA family toxin [Firmicutes bacterium]|nr:type II toxin-antitoxin system HicA family toxin [Bacillota bacterium]
MSRLVMINAISLEKILFKLSFRKMRQKGSHAFYRHPDGRTTTIPFHLSKDLPRPLLRGI